MEHAERWQLAQDLCARMVAKYPGDVIVGGVYGSTARGADTPWSDLELFFVVRDSSIAAGRQFIYRDIAVGYQVIRRQELEALLTNPSLKWPFHMGVLNALRVLHGDAKVVQEWLRLGQSIPQEQFQTALEACLPELIVESYGRILSCRQRGNTQDIGCAVLEVLFEMQTALCLLNRRWVTHDYYQGLIDTFSFQALPEGYRELVPALWSARDPDEIVVSAQTLVGNFWHLLAEQGVRAPNYHSLSDVPI